MRIIAGKHKSRVLKTLEGMNTRPMTDRMKESIFNCIGPYFDDLTVLDLFGGSGALSLEAISRGCSHSIIVDNSRDAIRVINENVNSLKENDKVSIFTSDYKLALKKLASESFDIIFLDPPYRMNIVGEIVEYILDNKMINKDGYIICQFVRGNLEKLGVTDESFASDLIVKKNYSFGNSEVLIYQKK